MRITYLIGYFIIIILLQSCADVAMSGASAMYNKRSIQKNIKDQYVTMQAYKALKLDNDKFKDANISIATFNGDVLLAGQVPQTWQRAQAEQIVKQIANINHVYNLIAISNPSSSLIRMSDTWITTKIKAKMFASNDLDAAQVKVVTENGTVYLMGTLLPEEAQAAVNVASTTTGVERVVKIFSYVKITKTI